MRNSYPGPEYLGAESASAPSDKKQQERGTIRTAAASVSPSEIRASSGSIGTKSGGATTRSVVSGQPYDEKPFIMGDMPFGGAGRAIDPQLKGDPQLKDSPPLSWDRSIAQTLPEPEVVRPQRLSTQPGHIAPMNSLISQSASQHASGPAGGTSRQSAAGAGTGANGAAGHSANPFLNTPFADAVLSGEALNRDGTTSELTTALHQLVRLVANVTESYTSAIFLSNQDDQAEGPAVTLSAVHTLSREIVPAVRIAMGAGLVGWTAENRVRISVCPFEHDATTLLYYAADQALKSFIALPVLSPTGELLGVLACDSKKSYAFAKVTEKVLIDCAEQAAAMILLHRRIAQFGKSYRIGTSSEVIDGFLERLRTQHNERELLNQAAEIPSEVVERDALVVITVADGAAAPSAFYSTTNQVRVGHRLLELVCRHKRVICPDRSIQTTGGADGMQDRSFLSIPFHIGKREAGSINLLSRAGETFSTAEISALERMGKVLGRELELFRLRDRLTSPEAQSGLLSWEQFSASARAMLTDNEQGKQSYALIRIVPENIGELEDFLGVDGARRALDKLCRLVEQVKGSTGIAGLLYGHELFILSERREGERILGRLERLLERLTLDEPSSAPARVTIRTSPTDHQSAKSAGVKVSSLVSRGLAKVLVTTPKDGDTLEELVAKTNRLLESAQESASNQMVKNVSNW